MKKALSLILALVMCLSLCACGDGNIDIQNPTDGKPNNSNEDRWLRDWVGTYKTKDEQQTLEICEDGICVLNGKAYTWENVFGYGDHISITLFDGITPVYGAGPITRGEKQTISIISLYTGAGQVVPPHGDTEYTHFYNLNTSK